MAPVISDSGIDFLKLHHLHIVRHTAMGREYQKPAVSGCWAIGSIWISWWSFSRF